MKHRIAAWFSSRYEQLVARGPSIAAGVALGGCGAAALARYLLLHNMEPGIPTKAAIWSANALAVSGSMASIAAGIVILLLWDRRHAIARLVDQAATPLKETNAALEAEIISLQAVANRTSQDLEVLAGLMENSQGFISVKDVKGRYLAVNRRFATLHQRDPKQLVGFTDFDLIHPAEATKQRSSDMRVITSGLPYELEDAVTLSDEGRTLLVHKFPLRGELNDVIGVCAIAQDITDRKRAATELRESRRQLESLLGQLPGMAFRWLGDRSLKPVYVSRGALALTGYTARELCERHIEFLNLIDESEREIVRDTIMNATRRRQSFETEFRIKDRDGAVRWVMLRGQGCHDEEGRALYIEGLAIDVTTRRQAENEKVVVERKLQDAQRLESIGLLAGGIAHDFNNLLTSVLGNANLARDEAPADSPIHRYLENIEDASMRAGELCRQMLAYAGQGRFIVTQVNLSELISSTVTLLNASIDKRTSLLLSADQTLPSVLGDETQLRQVIMNLVVNASEALNKKPGHVKVSARSCKGEPTLFENAILAPENPTARFVELEFTDNGCGMSAETMARIFDPFFTTKFTGRGLGLSATVGILRGHKGGLRLKSREGEGTTFLVYLPACDTPAEIATPQVPFEAHPPAGGVALVVDDEADVRDTTSELLAKCGIRVDTATDGKHAVELFRHAPSRYDVILLDMTMPNLSGEETASLLREIRPDIRILFISGYNRREILDTIAGRDRISFLQKPFALDSLRKELTVLLS